LIVVSDTSPLLNLALIGQLDLLVRLYQEVLIPPAVYSELSRPDAGPPQIYLESTPWLTVVPVRNLLRVHELSAELDSGEAEAIVLALERRADLLLVDERRGRRIAAKLGLRVTGLLGTLAEAKRKGLVARVKPLLDDLRLRAGFWIGEDLYAEVLTALDEA
jgi:uncharacterized protein